MNTDLAQCKRCGQCMSVCPVYQATFREADVARGKLALIESIESGTMEWSRRLEAILSRCLLCGACAEVCANRVETTRIIQRYRQRLHGSRERGDSRSVLLSDAMEGKATARAYLKGGALVQALTCKKIPESSGLHLRFPLSFFTERRTVPAVAWTPFLDAFPAHPCTQAEGPRIGFFVGCGANYLFPGVAWALVSILDSLRATLIVPEEQVCCGLPAHVSGDDEAARKLARRNIEAFESLHLDAVLTVCASCGSHLTGLASLFADDPSTAAAAASLAKKHVDAMAFLLDHLHFETYLQGLELASQTKGAEALRVAYHDPCHLRLGQGVTEAPRRLLAATPGVHLVEAPHAGRCCGHGGAFNLSHFPLSMNILERRLGDFEKVKPDRIVTGCTGCLLQFVEGISRWGLEGKVSICHPLVLVQKVIASCQTPAQQQKNLPGPQIQKTGAAR